MSVENPKPLEPSVVRFDLCSQAFKQDPFPTLAKLRAQGPLIRIRLPLFGEVWMATTYNAVNDLLRDHHRFIQNPVTAGNRFMAGFMRWLPRSLQPIMTSMITRDEPDHRRLRGLVERAFLRQSVEALRPRLEALADEAIDRLAEQGARSPGGVDLLTQFARPFPLAVICELLGLPPEDRPKFTRWASRISTAGSFAALLLAMPGISRLMRYLREEIQRQTEHPRDGLLSALIQAEEAGDRLTEDELLAMVFLLLLAGHETTLHQIAGSVLILLDHPEQLRELTADWSLADSAVQELLRYLSFAQVTEPRYAREDLEFQGRTIRRGQMLIACLASANSDPSRFENPDQLDLHREPNRHVAFGAGIHACLGAKLARAETEIALERLFTRFPNLQLAVPRSQVRYTKRIGARGLVQLPVRW
ncbi:MAG: cytochrome P450 [Paludisphaera borealis]|uniref:cytochrome P450 family protein n=1 Tax=Paludisphaera borealis TaxID=1387353 RepID=UPI0028468988|nr:cytochrome P450 [Paludisphaera borealis]MDR3619642.1 cytochrome P450 [Paludisphaera borealis]